MDMNMNMSEQQLDLTSPLNKRRRFAPDSIPMIASSNNNDIVHHNFSSPLLLQLCEQSPSQQEIEAQLVQVGMKVRKPAEGSCRQAGTRSFTPRPFFNSARLSPETIAALSGSNDMDCTNDFTGGLCRQPISTSTFCGINLSAMSHVSPTVPIEEQKLWSYSTSAKRQHHDDDSDSDGSSEFMPTTPILDFADAGISTPQDYFNFGMDSMTDVASMQQHSRMQAHMHGRRLAQPRSRARTPAPVAMPVAQINPFAAITPLTPVVVPRAQGHGRTTSCAIEACMDFSEANFLRPQTDFDMDMS